MDPFAYCPVKNCDITYKYSSLSTADIVIFHLHRMKNTNELPSKERNPNQIWAYLTDESPHHTFLSGKIKLKELDGVFNWSMTYRWVHSISSQRIVNNIEKKVTDQFKVLISRHKRPLYIILFISHMDHVIFGLILNTLTCLITRLVIIEYSHLEIRRRMF